MESFQDTALQMLREFRKLLSNTPIPIITTKFLQYLALNMFAIENSRPKGKHKTVYLNYMCKFTPFFFCSYTCRTGLLVYST